MILWYPLARGGLFYNQHIYMAHFIQYLKDTRGELKHVNWPTRKQAIWFTVVVVLISLVTAAYLGALDWLFTGVVQEQLL